MMDVLMVNPILRISSSDCARWATNISISVSGSGDASDASVLENEFRPVESALIGVSELRTSIVDRTILSSSMMLDFQSSGMDDARALRELTNIGDQRKLGIVKVMPDLDGDAAERQVFVAMDATARGRLPVGTSIRRFGNMPDSTVVPDSRLSSASASGQYYLIRGDQSDVGLHDWLNRNGVTVTWGTDSLRDDIRLLVSQLSFMMSMAAALALIATMVLYWIASKVRSRALRVLAGVSTWRIQKDDMMGVLVPSLCAASCDGRLSR